MAKTFEDGRDWRDAMIAEDKLSTTSISNYLKALKALFAYAYDNEHIKGDNPMARVKYDPGEGRKRDDFTIDERRKILLAARDAEDDIKWLTFLSHYALTRTSEIADASSLDIVYEDGVWLLKITRKNRSKDQRVKTAPSIRKVAFHSALLAEGFLAYRESVGDGPLFPMLKLDSYGKRAGQASNRTGEWLRNKVGITDPISRFTACGIPGLPICGWPAPRMATRRQG
jgi:integrase